ncbi:MAG TPA: hypothetical protein VF329_13585 [Gammaproteobacteria bacterium]
MRSLALALFAAAPALAQPVRPTLDETAFRLEVTWITSHRELAEARRLYGAESFEHSILHRGPEDGFAVLLRVDGELVCRLNVHRPERVDDDATAMLGHELLHCLAGDFHR